MKLSRLLEGIELLSPLASPDTEVAGVCYDSRKAATGRVFVCINGTKLDGHDYAAAAVSAGAYAVIAERVPDGVPDAIIVRDSREAIAIMAGNLYGNPARSLRFIGVTGTNGKTTTTHLIRHILEASGSKTALIGTNYNLIGDDYIDTASTTPEPLELHALLRRIADAGCKYVIMEVSSHSLAQKRVHGLHYSVGVFTNLTQDHLDLHGSMEEYLRAKQMLFEISDTGVISLDDPAAYTILAESTSQNFTYSLSDDMADVTAKNILLRADGASFDVVGRGVIGRADIALPCRFNVQNALAAVTTGMVLGIQLTDILAHLRTAQGVKGRAEVYPTGRDFTVVIDYAHSPDGLDNILSSMRELKKGRLVALFGCGGDRDKGKRPKMGAIAARLADFCIVTSDNPRTERPGAIIDDILPGVEDSGTPHIVIENRREAIKYAVREAQPGDLIVLAGKGHETYQILGEEKIHFDEREVLRDALDELEK